MSEQTKIMERMQAKAAQVSQQREELASNINLLETAQQAAKDHHYPYIRQLVRKVIKSQDELMKMIKDNPGLFKNPKTMIVDNVRYGLRKQPGKTVWNDDDALIKSIRALIKKGEIAEELEGQLIKQVEKPVVAALEKLDNKVLKKLGVTIQDATDTAVIGNVDSAINKILDAMLKDSSIIELEALEQ